MTDDNAPRDRDEARRRRRNVDALLQDKLGELARLQRRPSSDALRDGMAGMMFEVLDSVRYRLREFAADRGRSALPDDEVAVVAAAAREMIALAVELEREDERARARALGERPTAPAAPKGSFSGKRPPPVPPRALAPTVPIDPSDRVTAPAPPPYRGQPRAPSGDRVAVEAPFMDDVATPDSLVRDKPTPVRKPPRGR